ncbi:MAG: glycosyl hydrolase 115 family protein, partial [Oscillospiraceae bacterium]|nr:glycosyl hydrolase 115 family protein [Oscillospiraceae bacterium]
MRSQVKRALSMSLILVLVLGILPAYAAPDSRQAFADIEGHWAQQAIETWSGYDVIKGYNGNFRPDAAITRAETAQVITNLLKLTKKTDNIFFDVEAGSWYAEAVQKCAAAGIMVGDSGRFRPGDLISRQEAMAVVARTLGIKPVENPDLSIFKDGETADPWTRGLLAALVAAKIVQGTTGGLLAPLADISRAEIVAILNKAVSAYIAQPGAYTLDAQHSGGTVLVVSQGVTLDGTAAGTLVIGAGAESGAVVLRDFTADAVIVAARAIRLDITGKSRLQSLELLEQAEQAVLEIGRNAVVSDITPLEDTQIVREKIPSGDSGSSGNQSAVSLQGGENVSGLSAGEHADVAFTVTPAEAVLTAVSSDTTVATASVSEHTVQVTGVAEGTATITVTASASGYQSTSAKFTVSVIEETAADADFVLFDGSKVPAIYVSADDHRQVTRAVTDLQKDVERVTDKKPVIQNTAEGLESLAIIVGSIDQSPVIKGLMAAGKLDEAADLEGKWESYLLKIVENPMSGVAKALVIAGSDKRGTAYGIYDLSEQIGVSPWYYWGDILPQVRSRIVIDQPLKFQGEPSVKYRGIFINDEQALAQWAAVNDPVGQTGGNLGPDTYEKVFELLLRLKANYLWPAMHSEPRLGPSDHFSKYPETRQLADDYGIIVGSSHCEPMTRNGTVEWGEFLQANGYLTGVDFAKAIGTGSSDKVDSWMYNYNKNHPGATPIPRYDYSENTMYKLAGQDVTQKAFIDAYWNSAVEMYKNYAVSYTLGMRGLHDEGFGTANASSTAGKLNVLQAVVDSQVKMLKDNEVNKDSISIFVPYKEVLPLYDAGLKLPDDTIIVWAEDNHGYIRRFPTEEENARGGGNGVYYHVSYVGTQTYIWMNSTPPALMLSELGNAYDSGIKSLWVLNVGDIKPSEIGTEF